MNKPHFTNDVDLTFKIDSKFKVDPKAGTLHDLAIMTGGRQATGHGIYIDKKTITTGFNTIQAAGGQLRASIRHASLLDSITKGGDRVLDMPGFLSDVRVEDQTLVAGKFEFYASFRADNAGICARLLEMAEKTPSLFGLSAEPGGKCVWVADDENETETDAEYDPQTGEWCGKPDKVALKNEGLPTLRINRLAIAAFVDQPAANDGLFARFARLFSGKRIDVSTLHDVAESFLKWSESQNEKTPAAKNAFVREPSIETTQPGNTPITEIKTSMTIQTLTEKFGADEARLNRAVKLLGVEPTLTVEALDSKLAAADYMVLQASVKQLTDENTKLSTELSATKKESGEWRSKFESIKTSGHLAAVNTGTPSNGGTGEMQTELTGLARTVAHFATQTNNPANKTR